MAEAAAVQAVVDEDADFDKLFREAADAAQQGKEPVVAVVPPTEPIVAAVAPAASEATPPAAPAAAAPAPGETKTAEELAAEQKVKDDAAAAQKVIDDAAAAARAVTDGAAKILADQETARLAAEALKKPKEETADEKKKREDFEASIAPYNPTDDEKAALAKFQKEFPEEYVAVEARFKSLDKTINSRVASAIASVLQQINGVKDSLVPLVQDVSDAGFERHITAVKAAHTDFDAVVPLIPAWIKTQPAYLQPAMQHVVDNGTTADVIALVTQYKTATGATTPSPAPSPSPAPADADDLAPVTVKRAAPTAKGAPDMNDYEGAFAEAAAAAK